MKVNDQPFKVHAFLKQNAKSAYCNDCLGKKIKVNRHHINTITSTLSLFPKEFSRRPGICPRGCSSREKLLTMAI